MGGVGGGVEPVSAQPGQASDDADPWGLNPEPAPVPAAKKKNAPSKATPHGIEWAALVDRYFVGFERVRGVRPLFDGADGRALQRLLDKVAMDYARAGRIIDNALADPWWGPKVTIREIAANPSRFDRTKSSRRVGAHMQKPPMNADGSLKQPDLVDLDD